MISDELLKFVREQLASNVPQEQIVAILKPGGWTEADVAEALKALHVGVVQKPVVPVSTQLPIFQQGESGVNTAAFQPVQNPVSQPTISPVTATPNPAEVNTQFQTTFRLQTMPAAPTSKTKWPLIFVLILFLFALAGAGVWYFLYRAKAPAVTPPVQEQAVVPETEKTPPVEAIVPPPPVVFGQDLLMNWTKIPDDQNSAVDISAASALITQADKDFLSKFFGKGYDVKNLPTPSAATAVAARNVKTLQAFSTTSAMPLYQCSAVMTPEQCNFEPLRDIGRFLLLRSYVLQNAFKIPEALSIATNLADLGRKVTAGADEVVPLLVGWELQKNGYQRIAGLNTKTSAPVVLPADEKANRVNVLRDEQRKVFRLMYTRQAEGLEYLADENKVPSFPQSAKDISAADEYRKSIALGKFNLEETKRYFYDSYKIQIANVGVACGGQLAKPPYDFSAEVHTATSTGSQSSIENYVGKILYWTTYTSFDSLNAKRCEVEDIINKL